MLSQGKKHLVAKAIRVIVTGAAVSIIGFPAIASDAAASDLGYVTKATMKVTHHHFHVHKHAKSPAQTIQQHIAPEARNKEADAACAAKNNTLSRKKSRTTVTMSAETTMEDQIAAAKQDVENAHHASAIVGIAPAITHGFVINLPSGPASKVIDAKNSFFEPCNDPSATVIQSFNLGG